YLMRFLLEKNGFAVVEARDGFEGIELAKKMKPRLILLDIQLPRMDGYAVARALKKSEDVRNIPIVAVTSYAMVGDREKVLEAGADDYLEKPIDPDNFVETIKKFL
ncbi:MAG TPA: response regulator, partial [Smithella sp.]|nr:response regulator [Smithella sp.]